MKKLVEDVQGEGLEKLLGDRVTLFCGNYIYTGKLDGVSDSCVLLTDAQISKSSNAVHAEGTGPCDWCGCQFHLEDGARAAKNY